MDCNVFPFGFNLPFEGCTLDDLFKYYPSAQIDPPSHLEHLFHTVRNKKRSRTSDALHGDATSIIKMNPTKASKISLAPKKKLEKNSPKRVKNEAGTLIDQINTVPLQFSMTHAPQTGMTHAPQTGMTHGPQSGMTHGPQSGMTCRPLTGLALRLQTGLTLRPQTVSCTPKYVSMSMNTKVKSEIQCGNNFNPGPIRKICENNFFKRFNEMNKNQLKRTTEKMHKIFELRKSDSVLTSNGEPRAENKSVVGSITEVEQNNNEPPISEFLMVSKDNSAPIGKSTTKFIEEPIGDQTDQGHDNIDQEKLNSLISFENKPGLTSKSRAEIMQQNDKIPNTSYTTTFRKKPGPKSKTCNINSDSCKTTSKENKSDAMPVKTEPTNYVIVLPYSACKKPGPKSKTMHTSHCSGFIDASMPGEKLAKVNKKPCPKSKTLTSNLFVDLPEAKQELMQPLAKMPDLKSKTPRTLPTLGSTADTGPKDEQVSKAI